MGYETTNTSDILNQVTKNLKPFDGSGITVTVLEKLCYLQAVVTFPVKWNDEECTHINVTLEYEFCENKCKKISFNYNYRCGWLDFPKTPSTEEDIIKLYKEQNVNLIPFIKYFETKVNWNKIMREVFNEYLESRGFSKSYFSRKESSIRFNTARGLSEGDEGYLNPLRLKN